MCVQFYVFVCVCVYLSEYILQLFSTVIFEAESLTELEVH